MAQGKMTRAELLLALRRAIPGVSVRRLGDLISAGTLSELAAGEKLDADMAFCVVLEGALVVREVDRPPRAIRAGESYGLTRYALSASDGTVKLAAQKSGTRCLAFTHDTLLALGLAEPIISAYDPTGSYLDVRYPIRPLSG